MPSQNSDTDTDAAAAINPIPPPSSSSGPIPAHSTTTPTPWTNVKFYHPPSTLTASGSTSASIPPPPATDPTPTASELKHAFLSPSRPPVGPDAPLLTSAARERLYPSKPRKTYTSVCLRLRLADRSQLEATFPIQTTLATVFAFVRASLDPLSPPRDLKLRQTVPRKEWSDTVADRTVRLDSLGWAPNAVVLVDAQPALTKERVRSELRNQAADVPVKTFDDDGASARKPGSGQTVAEGEKKDEGKKPMPKWLKGIVKK